MTITNEQISIFINSAIIGTIIYMFIYSKKGKDRSLMGYIGAIGSCVGLSTISIFIFAGAFFLKVCLTQPLYEGLFLPIIWYILAYHLIKDILNNDFGLNIHIINPNSKTFNIMERFKSLLLYLIFIIPLGIATFLIFREFVLNIDNEEINLVALFIFGCICMLITIFFIISMYCEIKNINLNDLLKISKEKLDKIGMGIFFSVFILVGIGSLIFAVRNNKEYEEKVNAYEAIEGTYINFEIASEGDIESGPSYFLEYSYEVNGKTYTVWTYFGHDSRPKEGSKKIIFYNPKNPNEAIIEGDVAGNHIYLISILFIAAPIGVIIGELIKKVKNEQLKEKFIFIGSILVNMAIMALGIGVYWVICSDVNDYTIHTAFKLVGFWIIIPIAFVLTGLINICYLVYQRLKEYRNNKAQHL